MISTMSSIVLFMSGTLLGMLLGLALERHARSYYLDRMREEIEGK